QAEEVGFEPTRPLRAYRFSRPAHSTALPLLRDSSDTIAAAGKLVKLAGFVGVFADSVTPGWPIFAVMLGLPCPRPSPLSPRKCAKKRAKRGSGRFVALSVPVACSAWCVEPDSSGSTSSAVARFPWYRCV